MLHHLHVAPLRHQYHQTCSVTNQAAVPLLVETIAKAIWRVISGWSMVCSSTLAKMFTACGLSIGRMRDSSTTERTTHLLLLNRSNVVRPRIVLVGAFREVPGSYESDRSIPIRIGETVAWLQGRYGATRSVIRCCTARCVEFFHFGLSETDCYRS